jgi:ribosomal protein S18 acetylase RimI-like enzyme
VNKKITLIEKNFDKLVITHPTLQELDQLILLYQHEDLDLRRLVPLSHESYTSMGKEELLKQWALALDELKNLVKLRKLTHQTFQTILSQYHEMLELNEVPPIGTQIKDPFNMAPVEREKKIEELKNDQLSNIVLIKVNGEIACSARVLFVEGNWEIVSIVTKKKFRGKGFASAAIQQVLKRYTQRPLFSFQQLHLVSYYLREYAVGDPKICTFSQLPKALQRDLFRMNIFWGPNVIIRINK